MFKTASEQPAGAVIGDDHRQDPTLMSGIQKWMKAQPEYVSDNDDPWVNEYVCTGYSFVRERMTGELSEDDLVEWGQREWGLSESDAREWVQNLDQMIDALRGQMQPLPLDGKRLYRGIPIDFGFRAGDVLSLDSITSTSLSSEVAIRFGKKTVMEIIPQNRAVGIMTNCDEAEVILAPETKLRVLEVRQGVSARRHPGAVDAHEPEPVGQYVVAEIVN